jgi:hypothetical protein
MTRLHRASTALFGCALAATLAAGQPSQQPASEAGPPRHRAKIEFNEGRAAYLHCLVQYRATTGHLDRAVHDTCRYFPKGSNGGQNAIVGYSYSDIVLGIIEALAPDVAACRRKTKSAAKLPRVSFFVQDRGDIDKVAFEPSPPEGKALRGCIEARLREVGMPGALGPGGTQIDGVQLLDGGEG